MSGVKIATAQSHSFPSGALSFISCTSAARDSIPLDENEPSQQTTEYKTESKKRKFHPLRNLRRMFRRKGRRSAVTRADSFQATTAVADATTPDRGQIPSTNLEPRSCSTSRLQEEVNLVKNNRLNPGLSLSHDSIFTPDRADSGLSSSDLENSSLSITVLTPPSREFAIKSQSSCSETSLLSIGSSEVEFSPVRNQKRNSDLDLGVTAYKLSHSAAKHKMAVKPRRNHGAPRSRRKAMTSISPLPTTVEVSEEGSIDRNSSMPETVSESSGTIVWSRTGQTENLISVNGREDKCGESSKLEDEQGEGREEESSHHQRAESFFGRFLSRRSEKKKKHGQETGPEDGASEEKSNHFGMKFSRGGKGPNRRQRIEPMDIPSSPGPRKSDKEDSFGRNISVSASPPRNWPNQGTPKDPASPPEVSRPELFFRSGRETSTSSTKVKTTEISPTELRNPDFVRELSESVISFGKDETDRRKKEGEEGEDGESGAKAKVKHSDSEMTGKTIISIEDQQRHRQQAKKFPASDAVGDVSNLDVVTLHVAAKEDSLFGRNPFFYDVAHGYENIEIIERVRQEKKCYFIQGKDGEGESGDGGKENSFPVDATKSEIAKSDTDEIMHDETRSEETEKKSAEICGKKVEDADSEVAKKRAKPAVSQKPKDLMNAVKVSVSKVDARNHATEDSTEGKPEKDSRKTLIELRKTELLLQQAETVEKERKSMAKPLRKQASFKEISPENQSSEETLKSLTEEDVLPTRSEPQETVEGVVFRRKSLAGQSDDQPELMKVFARRSLKVRECERTAESGQKSRDSDKENEMQDSPKEERKANFEGDDRKEEGETEKGQNRNSRDVESNVKPEASSRKNIFQRYGRSLSENNVKSEEGDSKSSILEKSNLRKVRKITEKLGGNEKKDETTEEEKDNDGKGGGGGGEDERREETGFKRIQQRKAEWERRARQSAK